MAPLEAVVDVNRRPIAVPRYLIEITSNPPRRWTIVPTPKAARRVFAEFGDAYAVCPSCRHRMALKGRPRRMQCSGCKYDFDVAWDESYLEEM